MFQRDPFTLGVASGDPTSDGIVLWTRLAPDPLNGGGMPPVAIDVDWEVAHDDAVREIVRRGRTVATPDWAHSVHVEVDGLEPARWYWYRFRAGDAASPIGRTRTLPAGSASVDRLRFAFVSCQHYEMGHYTACRHLAGEEADLVFHLGDYIYEHAADPTRVRVHNGPRLVTLDDYRNRYALYKADADLQAAHAAFPFVGTWDDHEVSDNYASRWAADGEPDEAFDRRRVSAYQAYYEHMPLRSRSRPRASSLQLYRDLSAGSLVTFYVLDTRQFRSRQPCGRGSNSAPCEGMRDPAATLLGADQSRWLMDGLSRSAARWNVLPQQVLMAKVDRARGPEELYSMDQWAGYEVERTRLLSLFAARPSSNPVVLTGDVHSNWVNDLKVDFLDPKAPVVATELVGTSISSGGDGSDLPEGMMPVIEENPFVRFYNSQRGYVLCDVTPQRLRADFRVVEYVSRPGSPVRTRASFVVESGRAGAQRLA